MLNHPAKRCVHRIARCHHRPFGSPPARLARGDGPLDPVRSTHPPGRSAAAHIAVVLLEPLDQPGIDRLQILFRPGAIIARRLCPDHAPVRVFALVPDADIDPRGHDIRGRRSRLALCLLDRMQRAWPEDIGDVRRERGAHRSLGLCFGQPEKQWLRQGCRSCRRSALRLVCQLYCRNVPAQRKLRHRRIEHRRSMLAAIPHRAGTIGLDQRVGVILAKDNRHFIGLPGAALHIGTDHIQFAVNFQITHPALLPVSAPRADHILGLDRVVDQTIGDTWDHAVEIIESDWFCLRAMKVTPPSRCCGRPAPPSPHAPEPASPPRS